VFEGFFDGDALRVNDRFLGCDDDFSFHSRDGRFPVKKFGGMVTNFFLRSEFFVRSKLTTLAIV
jgi:hypothetical protein